MTRLYPPTLGTRLMAGLLMVSLVGTSMPRPLHAAGSAEEKLPPPVRTPKAVRVNKAPLQVEPLKEVRRMEQNATDEQIQNLGVFAQPLVPAKPTQPEDNAALAGAINGWINRLGPDDFSSLEAYLGNNGASPWALGVRVNLARSYYQAGWFSKAESEWRKAWEAGRNEDLPEAKALADVALAGVLGMNARLGRFEAMQEILKQAEGRVLIGSAAEVISQAKGGLYDMLNRPGISFRCGPAALGCIQVYRGVESEKYLEELMAIQSPQTGFNLHQVWELSEKFGMKMQMAYREPGSRIITPSVVHWKVNHYGAFTESSEQKYHLQDITFVDDFWLTANAVDHEASGYFLIPQGELPEGWRKVGKEEGQKVWGKGNTASSDNKATGTGDTKCPTCPPHPGGQTSNSAGGGELPPKMAVASIQAMLVSLTIWDTPVGYQPPYGPSPLFVVTYSQRESGQPTTFNYSNLGPNWTFDWLSYITYNPNSATQTVQLYARGGGGEIYSGFSGSANTSTRSRTSPTWLTRSAATGSLSFIREHADGSREIYDQDDGVAVTAGTTEKRAFLRQIVDPQGNTLTFTYDSSRRIISATDALGQVTTISYGSGGTFYRISQVTDPFGRTATFEYSSATASGQLTKIRDVIGIESIMTYSGNFVNSLTTPYGTSVFEYGEQGTTKWLETTDPLGDKERVEFRDLAPGIPASVPYSEVPVGIATFNAYMNARNTFYWDKKAYKEGKGDYTKAKIYHWMHQAEPNVNSTSRILESIKEPFSSRVWFDHAGSSYQGNANPAFEGTNEQPTKIAQLVTPPTGSTPITQLQQFSYNGFGKVTESIDPVGRKTVYTYASNGLDLIQVDQLGSGGLEKLAAITYNANHQPLTMTDAAGQTTTLTYNARGQVLTETNAKSETTTYTYDTNGYLTNVDGPLSGTGDSLTLTYDGFGRMATLTDGEGYSIAVDYDVMDRPTLITYPDSTTEQIVYDRLDVVAVKDRAGKVSRSRYNAIRQLVLERDPLGRETFYAYCKCGDVRSITDALGRVTRWTNDVQGRKTSKIYPDGTTETYAYDLSSRLSSITDALGQVKTFRYNIDDSPVSVTYSNEVHSTPDVAYTWDTYYPRMATRTDGAGTTTLGYYPITSTPTLGAGRLATIDGALADDTIAYEYDELGRTIERSINGSANEAIVTYDAGGRVTDITNVLGNFDLAYVGATGRLASVTAPNGLITALDYFGNLQDRRLKTLTYTGPGSTAISAFEYDYDVTGQITQWIQSQVANTAHPELVWDLEQDAADQLTGVTIRDGGTVVKREANVYDRAGNRLSSQINQAVKSGSFNNLNQLTAQAGGGKLRFVGTTDEPADVKVQGQDALMNSATNFSAYAEVNEGTNNIPIVATDGNGNRRTNTYQVVVPSGTSRSFTYDLNGNLLNDGTRQYQWDAEDRCVKITQGSDVYEFAYDGTSRKISETVNGTLARRWVYDGLAMAEERNAGNAVTKRFFELGEQAVGVSSPSDKLYYTQDHLGSIREVTDAAGGLVSALSYSSWGTRTVLTGSILPSFGYTGHWNHAATGLVVAPFRFYDPETGRWQSRDPIGENGGLNLYGYVSNNPTNAVDPLGLEIKFEEGIDAKSALNDLNRTQIGRDTVSFFNNPSGPDVQVCSTDSFSFTGTRYEAWSKKVYWNPNAKLDFGPWGFNDPSLMLLHELIHAMHHAENPLQYFKNKKPTGPPWDNYDEYLTIQKVNKAARELGQTERKAHRGGSYQPYEK